MTAIKGLALQGKWPVPGPAQNDGITQRLKVLRDQIKPERRSEDFLKASKRKQDSHALLNSFE